MQKPGRRLPYFFKTMLPAGSIVSGIRFIALSATLSSLGLYLGTPVLAQTGAKAKFAPYQQAPINSPNYRPFQLNTEQIAVLTSSASLAKTPLASVLVSSLTQAAINNEQPHQANNIGHTAQSENQAAKMAMVLPNAVRNRIMYRPATAAAHTYLSKEGEASQSEESQELQLARRRAALNLRLLTALLQVVQGMGEQEKLGGGTSLESESLIKEGADTLTALAGAGQAKWALDKLSLWAKKQKEDNVTQGESALAPPLSPLAEQDEAQRTIAECLAADSEIHNIKALLGIHDAAPSAVERTLSTVSMVPLIFTKVASVAQAGVESGSGGGRIARLSHVVHLGQKLDNRSTFISREVQLLIYMDNFARARQNSLLSAFARETLTALKQGR